MGPISKLASYRRRFNQLAAAVGEGRELSRGAALTTQALQRELAQVTARQETLDGQLQQIAAQLASLVEAEHERMGIDRTFRTDVIHGMRRIHADEAWHRRRLRELRATPEYERAYEDPDPLISVLIPTYDRLDLLTALTRDPVDSGPGASKPGDRDRRRQRAVPARGDHRRV